jgi:hypothetical protein
MNLDASGWSGDGDFTARLIEEIRGLAAVDALKVEDAPASRADAGFSFISNELFVVFASTPRRVRIRKLGFIPASSMLHDKLMTLGDLESVLAGVPDIGIPEYSDAGMLQYLRTTRIMQPYQSRGYKLIELVRIYEASAVAGGG